MIIFHISNHENSALSAFISDGMHKRKYIHLLRNNISPQKKKIKAACRRLSEAQYKSYTIPTRAARKLHGQRKLTSSQATKGSDFTSKA